MLICRGAQRGLDLLAEIFDEEQFSHLEAYSNMGSNMGSGPGEHD